MSDPAPLHHDARRALFDLVQTHGLDHVIALTKLSPETLGKAVLGQRIQTSTAHLLTILLADRRG